MGRAPGVSRAAIESEATLPWHDSELAHVEGAAVVYSVDRAGGAVFHLHGGRRITAAEAHRAGLNVRLPKRPRHEPEVCPRGEVMG
jgi:hypothetical protein